MSNLAKITQQINELRQQHNTDAIAIGRLLTEAKKQIPHGEWLPWLRKEFAWSKSAAARFMQVYKKFGGDKQISQIGKFEPSTLYLLAEEKTPPEAVKAVLDLVKNGKPIAHKDAVRIVKDARPPEHKKPPPAPKPLRDTAAIETFGNAIAALSILAAKPAATFVGIAPRHELEMLARFLMAIADATRKAA
jgi:hypothetical protein